MAAHYDVLIIGGGMVGASLAVALRDTSLKVGIVEAVPLSSAEQPSYDARTIALSQGSKRIFDAMGVWGRMVEEGVTAIRDIHVSDRGHMGATRLTAGEEGVEALGYVVEAGVIGRGLTAALEETSAELICPATLTAIDLGETEARVTLDHNGETREVTAALVVAADGGRSTVRELLGARTLNLGYGQTAVIANVTTDREHNNVAYERFTDSGPLAMLPNDAPRYADDNTGHKRWALVWTVADQDVSAVLALDDETFLARLNERFGRRAGRIIGTSPRYAYPLGLKYLRDPVRQRLAFIGNAAHTIHPVGGQGFNLGLRDVAALAEVVADAHARGADFGSLATLREYSNWRRPDYLKVLGMTDGLARLFSNRMAPLALARNIGLMAMDIVPAARHLLARQAMGFTGRLPRLACGQPLIPRN